LPFDKIYDNEDDKVSAWDVVCLKGNCFEGTGHDHAEVHMRLTAESRDGGKTLEMFRNFSFEVCVMVFETYASLTGRWRGSKQINFFPRRRNRDYPGAHDNSTSLPVGELADSITSHSTVSKAVKENMSSHHKTAFATKTIQDAVSKTCKYDDFPRMIFRN
jgi:hypothetical protein